MTCIDMWFWEWDPKAMKFRYEYTTRILLVNKQVHKIGFSTSRSPYVQVGDVLMLVGDFNANAASRTLQSLWGHLTAVYNSKSFGGVDNILANVGKSSVLLGEEIGSGGSDHQAISAIITVGDDTSSETPSERKAKSLHDFHVPCQDAAQGSQCWNEVQWAMTSGIHQHPEWYPGLSANSPREQFQEVVHQKSGKCPLPCGVLGASLGASSALGASFSVSVLNEAKGSDGCLIEPQTEYEARPNSALTFIL